MAQGNDKHSHVNDSPPHYHFQHHHPHNVNPLLPPVPQNGWSSRAPTESAAMHSAGPSSAATATISSLPLSKLTPSCSRCRSKKLRCQFLDTNSTSACNNCLSKGLGDDCHRDVRVARGKRRMDSSARQTDASCLDRQTEMAYLRGRIEELEQMDRSTRKPPSPASTSEELAQGGSTPGTISSHASDGANAATTTAATTVTSAPLQKSPAMRHKRKEVEDAALILEEFAAYGDKRHATSSSSSKRLAGDSALERWQKPVSLPERIRLLQSAKQCPYAQDEVVVRELVSVYLHRVNHLAGHVIYGPGFQRAVEAFLSMNVEEIIASKTFLDPSCLATFMLVLCLGFRFHPIHLPPGRHATPGFLAVQSIRQRSLDPTQLWYSIARQSLAVEDGYLLCSIPALQAACLFLVRGREGKGWMRMLHQVAISSAQDFGLHRLGQAAPKSEMALDDVIRLECGVRIWNFLAMRDWSLARDQSFTFLIQAEQMTTRKPLNIEDEELEEGVYEPKPMAEWTAMSFVIAQIDLARLVRDSVIMRNAEEQARGGNEDNAMSPAHRRLLKSKLDGYIARLPDYFHYDSQINTPGLLPVQRWLLNQQLFDLQLRLQRSDLTDAAHRTSCLDLAESIITNQTKIRAICPVIDRLRINYFHLFGACMVVLLDLIDCCSNQGRQGEEGGAGRDRARARVMDNLQLFQESDMNGRGVRVLEVMLEYEEECHARARQGEQCGSTNVGTNENTNLTLVAQRIISEIRSGGRGRTVEHKGHIWPAFHSHRRSSDLIPDQSLLPTAGAWWTEAIASEYTSLTQSHKDGSGGATQAGPDLEHFMALAPFHHTKATEVLPPHQDDCSTDQGSVFNYALGLGFDPFDGHYDTTPQPGAHLAPNFGSPPPPPADLPQQYTHARYLNSLDNFNPIQVERRHRQDLHFGRV